MTTLKRDTPRGLLHSEGNVAPFQLVRYNASPVLADIVDCYWITRWNLAGAPDHHQELLPHPCIQVVIEKSESAIFGIGRAKTVKVLSGFGRAVGIKFWPGAFSAVSQQPACEFTSRKVPLSDVFGSAGDNYQREVLMTDDDARLIELSERLVLSQERMLCEEAVLARKIVEQIQSNQEIVKVEDIVAQFAMSKRSLQRLFSTFVGASPKWVIRRYRLHEAVADLESDAPTNLTELALRLNYFDQAHFIRDFTLTVGRPPGRYARMARKGLRKGIGE